MNARSYTEMNIPTSPNEIFAPGEDIAGYRVCAILGRGGFGTVYETERKGLRFALKVLSRDALFGSAQLAFRRTEREVKAIQALQHPGVPKVYELGTLADGRPYFVMELLFGMDMGAILKTHGRLSPEHTLSIAEALADVLDHVHAQGILHRDIKPGNVFLDRFPAPSRVVLLDFGLAKILDQDTPSLSLSREFMGSPHFTAPEQIRGEALDARADIYALGAFIYTMLTAIAPFEDYSGDWEQAVLFSKPTKPSRLAPLPEALDAVLLSALAKDKSKRPASAGALVGKLREVYTQSP